MSKPKKKRNAFKNQLPGNDLDFPPKQNEIEVSVFGPGYGESILIHIGSKEWLVIDSCIDPIANEPVPLIYLRKIGVSPQKHVKQIIASHWHDDHVRGLSKIVNQCRAADFVCSNALRAKEFLTLVQAYGTRSMIDKSGVDEFRDIIRTLEDRKAKLKELTAPKFAIADRILFKNQSCTVTALSPSDKSILLAKQALGNLIPAPDTPKNRLPALTPNHVAVVLWINIGKIDILLGSDLEETRIAGTGWSVIVSSTTRPNSKASLFKIPHHGSKNSDNIDVWDKMLEEQPFAVLTPFTRGKTTLPEKDDVLRICSRTDKAYATSGPKTIKSQKRPQVVEKQIREMGIKINQVFYSMGHVRFRTLVSENGSTWKTELFNGAVPLERIHD